MVENRRVLSLDLKEERESQFNTAGGSEFQVRGAAVLNDRLIDDTECTDHLNNFCCNKLFFEVYLCDYF